MIKMFDKFRFYNKGVKADYSAIVLDDKSKNLLLSTFIYPKPEYADWNKSADHMTICMGELPEHMKRYWLDEEVSLTVNEIGVSDKSIAVKVTGFFVISKRNDTVGRGSNFQHITLAFNPIDGKPSDSNQIIDWKNTKHLKLRGVVKEVEI